MSETSPTSIVNPINDDGVYRASAEKTQDGTEQLRRWWHANWDVALLWLSLVLLIGNTAWWLWPQQTPNVVWLTPKQVAKFPAQSLPSAEPVNDSPSVTDSPELASTENDSMTTSTKVGVSKKAHKRAYASKPKPRGPVSINAATQAQLQTLPGIGPAMAQRILAYRKQHGPFKTAEDLLPIKGIGEKKLTKLKPFLKF